MNNAFSGVPDWMLLPVGLCLWSSRLGDANLLASFSGVLDWVMLTYWPLSLEFSIGCCLSVSTCGSCRVSGPDVSERGLHEPARWITSPTDNNKASCILSMTLMVITSHRSACQTLVQRRTRQNTRYGMDFQ